MGATTTERDVIDVPAPKSAGQPGIILEQGTTTHMFQSPSDKRTEDCVTGRFG